MPSLFQRLSEKFSGHRKEQEVVSPMQRHGVIDHVAHDPRSDSVILAMVESRPWDEKEKMLFDLQEKLNVYIGYVVQGRLVQDYPQLEKKKVEIRYMPSFVPPPEVDARMSAWRDEYLTPRGIAWSVRVLQSA